MDGAEPERLGWKAAVAKAYRVGTEYKIYGLLRTFHGLCAVAGIPLRRQTKKPSTC